MVKVFHPTMHKVCLKVFQASCYSHHLSQYTLRVTNWLFRVSGYHNHVSPTNHRIIMHTKLMPIYNQPSNHASLIYPYQASSIQIPIYHIEHIRHHTWTVQSNQSFNHVKHTCIQPTLSISLRLKCSRSGKRDPLLKLPTLAWARLHTKGTSWSRSS